MEQLIHFTKYGVYYHAKYEKKESNRHGVSWQKVYGSEEPCQCADREEERKVLLGIGG